MSTQLPILAAMDWHQLWYMISLPDNVPIVLLLILVPFYVWMSFRMARRNDALIAQLEADPELAKTHHRTPFPYKKGWPKTVQVWPHLLKREFLAAIIVTIISVIMTILAVTSFSHQSQMVGIRFQ